MVIGSIAKLWNGRMAGIGKLSHSNDLIGACNNDLHVAPPSVVSMWSMAVLLWQVY